MKAFEDSEIEEMKELLSESLELIKLREIVKARRNLNTLSILLATAKEVPINPDLELGKYISLNGQSPQEKKNEEQADKR